MNISGIEIGGSNPCRFVAEISNNHNGDRDRCGRLIDAARDAGADFVKFQCFTVDELCALRGEGPAPVPWNHLTMRELYSRAQTPHEWFPKIKEHCERVGIPWFSSVFGAESLALLESLGCPAYKIARLDNQSKSLLASVRRTKKPVIISATTPPDWSPYELSLYCPPGYPQTRFGLSVDAFEDMSDCGNFDRPFDGFSYHGTEPLPCVVAATLGAKIIEAHFQLDDEPSELEANVSLTASQFAEMIRRVRDVEAMLV